MLFTMQFFKKFLNWYFHKILDCDKWIYWWVEVLWRFFFPLMGNWAVFWGNWEFGVLKLWKNLRGIFEFLIQRFSFKPSIKSVLNSIPKIHKSPHAKCNQIQCRSLQASIKSSTLNQIKNHPKAHVKSVILSLRLWPCPTFTPCQK